MKRILSLLVACVCFSSTGCLSGIIAESGKHLSGRETREELDACFGEPRKVEEIDGEVKVTYVTRKKIADPHGMTDAFLGAVITLGLSEPLNLMFTSGSFTFYTITGREVTYIFDKQGRLIEYSPDHSRLPFNFQRESYLSARRREEREKQEREEELESQFPY